MGEEGGGCPLSFEDSGHSRDSPLSGPWEPSLRFRLLVVLSPVGESVAQNVCSSAVVLTCGGGLLNGSRVSLSFATAERFHLRNAGVPRGGVSYSAEWL